MTTLKPMFTIGDKVVVIPFANLGRWTHVDCNLNQRGVATITDWDVVMPSNDEEVREGCPKNGYIEYKLHWAGNQESRAKYGYAETFLIRANTPLAKEIARYYKLNDKLAKLKTESDKTVAQLHEVASKFRGY